MGASNYIRDLALAGVQATNLIVITDGIPSTYAAAIQLVGADPAGLRCGSVAPGTISIIDGAVDGRRARVTARTGGTIEATGVTPTHWVSVDTVEQRILTWGTVSEASLVTDGDTFSLGVATSGFDLLSLRAPVAP